MDATQNFPFDMPVELDGGGRQVVLLAANIGAMISDDVFVGYTTLLLGLLHARLGDRDSSTSSTSFVDTEPLWRTQAIASLNVLAIIAEKRGLNSKMIEKIAQESSTANTMALPQGRPLLSISAKNVLAQAGIVALDKRGSGAVVTPPDIMASYLYTIPPAHKRQAEAWGLTQSAITAIGRLLPAAVGSVTPNEKLPDYDDACKIILMVADDLAGHWKTRSDPLIASETLLVSIVEAVPFLMANDAAEAIVLRTLLRADEPGSTYHEGRDAAYNMSQIKGLADLVPAVTPPKHSQNAQAILQMAKELAITISSSQTVAPRHLIAALICNPDDTDRTCVSTEWLQELMEDKEALRSNLAQAMSAHTTDNQIGWQALLIGRNSTIVASARSDTIPDDPRKADSLSLVPYADAIGALVAAIDQHPPLSIAIFGPWGSGKSFFMGMIGSSVKIFTKEAASSIAAKAYTPFLRRVVTIKFNAWHYAEENLWASLVHAILIGLQEELSPKEDPSAFQAVLKRLLLNQAAQQQAENKLRAAESHLETAIAALTTAETQASDRRKTESAIPTVRAIINSMQQETLAALRPATRDGETKEAVKREWIKNVGESVTRAAGYLGRPELARQVPILQDIANDAAAAEAALAVQVVQIRELLDEAKANTDRGLSLISWLANAEINARDLVRPAKIGIAVLLALVVLSSLFELLHAQIAAVASTIAAFVVPLVGAVTLAVDWARRNVAHATRAFAVLGSIRDRVEQQQTQRITERDEALTKAQLAVTEAEAEAVRRKADRDAAAAAVAKAREDLEAATSPERLKQFIAQRLAEGDYQRHLGLINTIRTDFDKLQTILKDVQLHASSAQPPATEGAKGVETAIPEQAEAAVERIVLYIDDLDRCPPTRVVEVLEAVHLLLAFKLFVVVVGVDIRWVSQALCKRYPTQLGDASGVASPTDYLEKVFQIPFWLPSMDAAAGRRLLEAAISPVTSAVPSNPPPPTDQPADAVDVVERSVASDTSSTPPVTPTGRAPQPNPSAVPQPKPPDVQAIAEALTLGKTERGRLIDMAAAVGASPRRTIRFANLYRLLKASLTVSERRGFVAEEGASGSYEGALILLAAATGAPRATRALISALTKNTEADPEIYLKACFDLHTVRHSERETFSAARTSALAVKDKALLVVHLQKWAPRVGCFIFDDNSLQEPISNESADMPVRSIAAASSTRRILQ
jgi:KAP family P-loop domain